MKRRFTSLLAALQTYGLSITLWLVVLLSFVAIGTKIIFGRPSSAPFHILLIIAMVAAVLAALMPNLETYILSKVSEIDIGGVKLIIARAREIRDEIKFKELQNSSRPSSDTADRPFPITKLQGFQIYEYEKLSHKLHRSFEEIDPNELAPDLRESYRDLIKHVGKMAFSMEHYSKYFDIISRLMLFKDRALTREELSEIGIAYLWAADEQLDQPEKVKFWKESVGYLTRSVKDDPLSVRSQFNLGVALLFLGRYQKSIRQMQKCIKLDTPIRPWAKWNIGCAYIKQNKERETLAILGEVEKGLWWDQIKADEWFTTSVTEEFRASFERLCMEKTT